MAEEKESTSIPLSQAENGAQDPEDPAKSPPPSPNSSTRKVRSRCSLAPISAVRLSRFDFILFFTIFRLMQQF